MSNRKPCDKCGARRGIGTYSNGEYCFSCGFKNTFKNLGMLEFTGKNIKTYIIEIPGDISNEFPLPARLWLSSYLIGPKIIETRNIKYSNSSGKIYFLPADKTGSVWIRDISPESRFKWLCKKGETNNPYFLKSESLSNELVIVEDVVSCCRIAEYKDCLALGGTSFKNYNLTPIILKYKKILVWLDGDIPGQRAAIAFRNNFKILRPVKIIKTKKDPKEHLNKEIEEILND